MYDSVYFLCIGHQPGADLGPLISPQAKDRVCDLVQSGADEGATVNELFSK
jgi:acyl-CoA reductase-like NAD-dependent aldehyde dehydrogenase